MLRTAHMLCTAISIHAPHTRSDVRAARPASSRRDFNPRSSYEERLHSLEHGYADYTFQSTLLMRGATRVVKVRQVDRVISIHAPHARSDAVEMVMERLSKQFQSTLLMRGATCDDGFRDVFAAISIHAPHARSDSASVASQAEQEISIHAPHARSDTLLVVDLTVELRISIHAPHARSDDHRYGACYDTRYFNPRSSCEERRASGRWYAPIGQNFNPRSSCEERRPASRPRSPVELISIHAPHARSDWYDGLNACTADRISIHAPHARSDWSSGNLLAPFKISIHAPHARSDATARALAVVKIISIHAPHARSDSPR